MRNICKIENCNNFVHSNKLCNKHRQRLERYGNSSIVNKRGPKKIPYCSIEGCNKTYLAKGYCTTHYERWRNHGNPLAQVRARRGKYVPKDAIMISPEGYRRLPESFNPYKTRFEHRVIAEKVLGRKLNSHKETVHHINGNKLDNRNCNLVICSSSYHKFLHKRMRQLISKQIQI